MTLETTALVTLAHRQCTALELQSLGCRVIFLGPEGRGYTQDQLLHGIFEQAPPTSKAYALVSQSPICISGEDAFIVEYYTSSGKF